MVKSELVAKIAVKRDIPIAEVQTVIDAALQLIREELAKGNPVQLIGFGTFKVKSRAARNGRNPRTGETIDLPESKRVHFTPGKTIRKELNHD